MTASNYLTSLSNQKDFCKKDLQRRFHFVIVPVMQTKPRQLSTLRIDPVIHYNTRLMAADKGTTITHEAEEALCNRLAEHRLPKAKAKGRKGAK
jgi:hypothetical protein